MLAVVPQQELHSSMMLVDSDGGLLPTSGNKTALQFLINWTFPTYGSRSGGGSNDLEEWSALDLVDSFLYPDLCSQALTAYRSAPLVPIRGPGHRVTFRALPPLK